MSRISIPSRLLHRLSIGTAALMFVGAVGLGGYNLASADIEEGERPVFVPITPCRLLDTRAAVAVGRDTPLGNAETTAVRAHGENGRCTGESAIPTDAVGLSMNVVAAQPTQRTFLTFWGGGDNPGTANLNPEPGQAPTPNAVNTPLSSTGNFNLFNNAGSVEVIIDVNGYYASHNHDDRYLTEDETDAEFDAVDTRIDDAETRIDGIEAAVPFLASGVMTDPDTGAASITAFNGPPGATAEVTAGGTGIYTVTITGLDGQIDGVVMITAFGDPSPGDDSTSARACSTNEPSSSASTFSFGVGCFGEDDTVEGVIVAEDSSFQFLVVG